MVIFIDKVEIVILHLRKKSKFRTEIENEIPANYRQLLVYTVFRPEDLSSPYVMQPEFRSKFMQINL